MFCGACPSLIKVLFPDKETDAVQILRAVPASPAGTDPGCIARWSESARGCKLVFPRCVPRHNLDVSEGRCRTRAETDPGIDRKVCSGERTFSRTRKR